MPACKVTEFTLLEISRTFWGCVASYQLHAKIGRESHLVRSWLDLLSPRQIVYHSSRNW